VELQDLRRLCYSGEFWIWFVIFLLGFRIVLSGLRALESFYERGTRLEGTWLRRTVIIVAGFSRADTAPDYWYNTALGAMELVAFPALMVLGEWSIIGGWIAFKALAQWRRWNDNRFVFNRFLLANAVQVWASLFLSCFVHWIA
jgi:hypothetical protein